MAPSIFTKNDFSCIFNSVNGYGHVFLDRIRERNWYELIYDNTNIDVFYYPELVKKIYLGIDTTTIDLEHNQFFVHFNHEKLLVTLEAIDEVTQIPVPPQHVAAPLPLIDYMLIRVAQSWIVVSE